MKEKNIIKIITGLFIISALLAFSRFILLSDRALYQDRSLLATVNDISFISILCLMISGLILCWIIFIMNKNNEDEDSKISRRIPSLVTSFGSAIISLLLIVRSVNSRTGSCGGPGFTFLLMLLFLILLLVFNFIFSYWNFITSKKNSLFHLIAFTVSHQLIFVPILLFYLSL